MAKLCKGSGSRIAGERFNSRVWLHTDAAQAVGKVEVDPNVLKVDVITVVGHKFYGPRIGALVLRNEKTVPLQPLFRGGLQEHGKRAGTENTPMIAGLGAACQIVAERLHQIAEHMRDVRDYFENQLKIALSDAVVIHFSNSERIPNTSSVSFIKYPRNAEDLLSKCKSFIASTGAACHAGTNSPSAVLCACGIPDEVASRTVRFSFGKESSRAQVDRVVNELKSIVFLGKYGSSLLSAINKGPIPGF
ncbi:Selenocysteine lyase [Toxocara canis]|uniref:Selenocysteine lyase n=1 Tax=Toxocara canis TaxID=6265 RepID=A0A0B2V4C5_TOXCA|nr:Selenocysteine lyase [Toxocara canis]